MSGVEIVVGGWFASAVIGRFVNKAGDYLDSNRALHNQTKQMLINLKTNLLEAHEMLKKAEKKEDQDEFIIEWVRDFKDASYEAKDVLDDFEAKRICKVHNAASSFATAAKNFILPDEDVTKLNAVVTNLEQLCQRSKSFVESLQLDSGLGNTDCEEEPPNKSGILKNQIFLGRDSEVKFILTLILGYEIESLEHQIISDETSHKVESLQMETKSEGESDIGTNFYRVGHQKISGIWKTLSQRLGKVMRNVVLASSLEGTAGSEATSTLKCATVEGSESIETISDKGKSSSIDVGSASKNVEPSTSQNNPQNQGTNPYGRPFVIPKVEVSELNDNVALSSTDIGLGFKVKNVEPSTSEISAQNQGTDPNGRPFVIPIVGISGVGKTTLAQTIYDHQFLKDHFDLKKFIYMSGKSDIDKIVQALLTSWGSNDHISNPELTLERKLILSIEHKRFLLVLDDVSSMNDVHIDLKRLCKMLSSVAYGSAILVTTQEHKVANKLGTINPINLNPLEWNYFLQLLEYYAFFDANRRNDVKLYQICEDIGKKLPRLPLVARMIGSVLNSEINEDNWATISRISWTSHIDKSIIPIIGKCFQDLNAKLKLCFAFCSIIPTNYIMERDRIIQMWIANDFIQTDPNDDSRLEDIGKMWFNELVNKSFFLSTPWPHKYIMHSTIRELARSILSREFYNYDGNPNPCPDKCFLMDDPSDPCRHGYSVYEGPRKIPPTTRYLTLIRNTLAYEVGMPWYRNLRTLLFYGDYFPSSDKYCTSMLKDTCKLRVLVLCYPGDGIKLHRREINNMSHLRFLDLSYTAIKEIPESVCSLYHLQVLDIRGCEIQEVPGNMNHLINLRHLYARKETISLISGIGKLTNLQELEQFKISKKTGHTISELTEMNEIGGHLCIVGLENVKDEVEAGGARLEKKTYLKVLSLNFKNEDKKSKANKILNSLQPHQGVEELEIENYPGTELPKWITTLSKIQCIYLKSCHHLYTLPHFGMLPYLETLVLELLDLRNFGNKLYGSGEVIFPKLKVLKIVRIRGFAWPASRKEELFPCLEELEISCCSDLKELPLHSLKLSCLKKLKLSHLPDLTVPSSSRILHPQKPHAGDNLYLSNLQHLILDDCRIPWNRGIVLRSLTKLEINGYLDEMLEMAHSSLPSLKVLKLNGDLIKRSEYSCLTKEEDLLLEYQNVMLKLDSSKPYETSSIYIQYYTDKMEALKRRFFKNTHSDRIKLIEKCTRLNEELSCWFVKLPHLVELYLGIPGLTEFPSTLATHVSLKSLKLTGRGPDIGGYEDAIENIIDMRIQSLPESRMPPNLKELYITDASVQLQLRCSKERGEDWHKIKHIPYIRINNRTLQML